MPNTIRQMLKSQLTTTIYSIQAATLRHSLITANKFQHLHITNDWFTNWLKYPWTKKLWTFHPWTFCPLPLDGLAYLSTQSSYFKYSIDWLIDWAWQRLHEHNIGYTADGFYRSDDPTNGIKVLKEKATKEKYSTYST